MISVNRFWYGDNKLVNLKLLFVIGTSILRYSGEVLREPPTIELIPQ